MKQFMAIFLLSTAVLSSCASEQGKPGGKKPDEIITDTSVITGTVIAVDYNSRMVTIKDRAGTYATLRVDCEVQNLSGIHKGSQVIATYIESIGIRVVAPGGANPDTKDKSDLTVEVGLKGGRPYRVTARVVELTAVVDSINHRRRHVSVRGTKGTILSFRVGKTIEGFENVKKGDEVVIYYTEPVAILIERVKQEK
ncbi:MAG TPA: hypothetical protein PKX40_01025 [Spirochaetota bacterium]|nr:hypothetical protein [Spirochaetota bacterium]